MKNLPNIGLPIILLSLLLIVFISRSSVNIGSGEAGVLFRTLGGGVVTDAPPKGEGFKIIAPWNRIVIYNVKQQEVLESMQVLSSNGLEITIDVSVLYQPVYDQLGLLHQTKGENYLNSVLLPNIRAVARSVVGRYTPEQLYSTKRDAIQNEIFIETRDDVLGQYIQLNSVLVRDVTLPTAIKEGIERKLVQEQEALEYEFRLVKAEQEAEMRAAGDANLEAGIAYLEANAGAEGVQATASGLQYRVVREGTGAKPTSADSVEVHYEGRLINGTVFDSSYSRGQTVTFGVTQVIPGWTEALQLMSEGAEYELTIPSNLAYGAGGAGAAIGPNEVLIFKVELVAVVSQ